MSARVVVYTRPGCHLCEDARAVVSAVCAELGETFEEVDITAGPESDRLTAAFGEEVPVTFVDGRQHDFWRVDGRRLRTALTTPAHRTTRPPDPPVVTQVTCASRMLRSVCSHVHKLLEWRGCR